MKSLKVKLGILFLTNVVGIAVLTLFDRWHHHAFEWTVNLGSLIALNGATLFTLFWPQRGEKAPSSVSGS